MARALEGLSDDEFRRELREHLDEGAWTVQHWLELERRGEAVLAPDPVLQAAMSAQRDRMLRKINTSLEPFAQRLTADFKAISEQFPRIGANFKFPELPKLELELPQFDLSRFFASSLASSLSGAVLDGGATVDALVDAQEELWQHEAERGQAELKAAEATIRQLALLQEVEQANRQRHEELVAGHAKLTEAVHSTAQPRWMMWTMISLAGVAAAAALAGLF